MLDTYRRVACIIRIGKSDLNRYVRWKSRKIDVECLFDGNGMKSKQNKAMLGLTLHDWSHRKKKMLKTIFSIFGLFPHNATKAILSILLEFSIMVRSRMCVIFGLFFGDVTCDLE